jgi:Xaa-Pro aminopeptidase
MKKIKLQRTRSAIAITEKALRKVLPLIRPGTREKDISKALKGWIKYFGAEKFSGKVLVFPDSRFRQKERYSSWICNREDS